MPPMQAAILIWYTKSISVYTEYAEVTTQGSMDDTSSVHKDVRQEIWKVSARTSGTCLSLLAVCLSLLAFLSPVDYMFIFACMFISGRLHIFACSFVGTIFAIAEALQWLQYCDHAFTKKYIDLVVAMSVSRSMQVFFYGGRERFNYFL